MASAAGAVETLSGTNLFSGLPQQTLDRIAAICDTCEYGADDYLYRAGDEARNIYVLMSGRVLFTMETDPQGAASGSVLSNRMVIGWAALLPEQQKRLASSQCIAPSKVICINGERLLEILRDDPASGFVVMQRLATMIARNFMGKSN